MDKGVHPYEPESGANSKWEKADYAHQTVEDKQEKNSVFCCWLQGDWARLQFGYLWIAGLSEGGRGSRRFRTGSAKNGQGNNEICSTWMCTVPYFVDNLGGFSTVKISLRICCGTAFKRDLIDVVRITYSWCSCWYFRSDPFLVVAGAQTYPAEHLVTHVTKHNNLRWLGIGTLQL